MEKKTKYVDGFVLIIPKNRVEDYKKMASDGCKIWMKHGALSYKECMLEDATPEHIKLPFPQMTKAGPDDTVWFSYIEYESRQHRDEVNAKVMADPSMQSDNPNFMENMPMDMEKMSYGGFEVVIGDE